MTVTGFGEKVVIQIGLIVQDIERSIEQYKKIMGLEKPACNVTEARDQSQATYHGEPMEARGKIACYDLGQVQYELIQPLNEGSTWMDYLKQHGEGIQHVALGVSNSAAIAASFVEHDYTIMQQGMFNERSGMYAYLNTERDLGIMLELLEHINGRGTADRLAFPADQGIGTNIVSQVGIIVDDIERVSQNYADLLGVPKPPIMVTAGYDVTETTYNGEPSDATAKLAFFDFGQLQIELIEPDEKPSVWREYLEEKGPGAQHIAFQVKNTQQVTDYLKTHGIEIAQQGLYSSRNGMYTYVRSENDLGVMIELLENY